MAEPEQQAVEPEDFTSPKTAFGAVATRIDEAFNGQTEITLSVEEVGDLYRGMLHMAQTIQDQGDWIGQALKEQIEQEMKTQLWTPPEPTL